MREASGLVLLTQPYRLRHAVREMPLADGRTRAHTVCVFARIRGWFDGAGWFVAAAGVLFFAAVLVAVLELQSKSALLWTGQPVAGTEQRGIAFYHWQGQSYEVVVPGYGSAKSMTLYLDPGDPSGAIPDSTGNRVADVLGVGVPFVAGVVVLVIGGTRNYRWKRRNIKRGETDWWMSKVPPRESQPRDS